MKRRRNQRGQRLRLVPLLVGGYAVYLGLGLTVVGLAERAEGIRIARAVFGLVLTGVGLLGLWDGLRDWIAPKKEEKKPPVMQFILTDADGKRSSNVTIEVLRSQLNILTERGGGANFQLQILTPVPVQGKGILRQIFCIYQEKIAMLAFFEDSEEAPQVWRTEPEDAEEVLRAVLEGRLDVSEWEKASIAVRNESAPGRPRQHMGLFGESWENHLQFFSIKDVELAVKGIANGKYRRIELELGAVVFRVFRGEEDESNLTLHLLVWPNGELRAFEKTGSAVQVNFWLIQMINEGLPEELHGWRDITAQMK